MLQARSGLLGIDYRTRNYYILDENGIFLTGSDEAGGPAAGLEADADPRT